MITITILSIVCPLMAVAMFIIGYNIGCHTNKPMRVAKKNKELSDLEKQIKEINEFQGW